MIEIKHRISGKVLKTVGADSLREADLIYTDLSDADLSYRNLSGADLYDTNLRGADLRGADLRGTNLSGADLYGTNLSGTNLRGTNLSGTDLSGVKGIIDLGIDPRGYRFVAVRHDEGWRIAAGCRWFTVPEAEAHWSGKNNTDALARVAILKAHP